ncbi:hypothetical protein DSL72_001472 [Monilinia vaccinii-corymbosi]|uniref:Uncharacterized protein n=1 Tax=Monilinia vaccinii-corymbosi TaxID=61207 RepID=A0A8A3P245_9HELO|nr:hypothetical protein DSL72_001472 [Monilinia vaccinii-corymbosi]
MKLNFGTWAEIGLIGVELSRSPSSSSVGDLGRSSGICISKSPSANGIEAGEGGEVAETMEVEECEAAGDYLTASIKSSSSTPTLSWTVMKNFLVYSTAPGAEKIPSSLVMKGWNGKESML